MEPTDRLGADFKMDCPACSQPYRLHSVLPKMLPCGHTICSDCIDCPIDLTGKPLSRARCPFDLQSVFGMSSHFPNDPLKMEQLSSGTGSVRSAQQWCQDCGRAESEGCAARGHLLLSSLLQPQRSQQHRRLDKPRAKPQPSLEAAVPARMRQLQAGAAAVREALAMHLEQAKALRSLAAQFEEALSSLRVASETGAADCLAAALDASAALAARTPRLEASARLAASACTATVLLADGGGHDGSPRGARLHLADSAASTDISSGRTAVKAAEQPPPAKRPRKQQLQQLQQEDASGSWGQQRQKQQQQQLDPDAVLAERAVRLALLHLHFSGQLCKVSMKPEPVTSPKPTVLPALSILGSKSPSWDLHSVASKSPVVSSPPGLRVLVSHPSVSPSGSVTLVQNGHGSAAGASPSPESPEQAAAVPRGIKVLLPRPRAKTPKTKTTSSIRSANKTPAAKPPKTEELDVSDLAKTRVYTKKMASTLDKAARVQITKLFGLHCAVQPGWALQMLQRAAPYLLSLMVREANEQHLAAIAAMPVLAKLNLSSSIHRYAVGSELPPLPLPEQLESLDVFVQRGVQTALWQRVAQLRSLHTLVLRFEGPCPDVGRMLCPVRVLRVACGGSWPGEPSAACASLAALFAATLEELAVECADDPKHAPRLLWLARALVAGPHGGHHHQAKDGNTNYVNNNYTSAVAAVAEEQGGGHQQHRLQQQQQQQLQQHLQWLPALRRVVLQRDRPCYAPRDHSTAGCRAQLAALRQGLPPAVVAVCSQCNPALTALGNAWFEVGGAGRQAGA